MKKYQSTKTADKDHEWEHSSIQLLPINPEFNPIEIAGSTAEDVTVIAEFVMVLS